MTNSLRPLVRSYLSLLRLPGLGVVVGILLLPGMFILMVGLKQGDIQDTTISHTFFLSYAGLAMFALNTATWSPLSRLLSRSRLIPLPTNRLAMFFLLFPATMTMLMNVAILAGYHFLYQSHWPIGTTSCWMGVSNIVLAAAFAWLRTANLRHTIAAPLTIVAWGSWIFRHYYPNGFLMGAELWALPTATDLFIIAAVTAISVKVWCIAFRKYRHGVSEAHWLRVLREPDPLRSPDTAPNSTGEKFSPAKTFLEMTRQHGRFQSIAAEILMIAITFAAVLLSLNSDTSPLEAAMVLTFMMAGMSGIIVGLFTTMETWLHTKGQAKSDQLRTHVATLPFSDAELGRLLIRSWLPLLCRMTMFFFLTVAGAVLLHTIVSGPRDYSAEYSQLQLVQNLGPFGGLIWLLGIPVIMWTVAGLFGTIVLAGRPGLALWSVVYCFTMAVVVMWAWHFGNDMARLLAQILLFILAVVTCGTIISWLLIAASRKQLITAAQAAICSVLTVALFVSAYNIVPSTTYWKWIAAGLMFLVAIPIPGIPMAISANRHR